MPDFDFESQFGPGSYEHSVDDVFTDFSGGKINFAYFKPNFDTVDLPMDLAKAALGDHYKQWAGVDKSSHFIKFIPLSTLRTFDRLPSYETVKYQLVDHRDVVGFALASSLSIWGGQNLYATTPCVFISHRWVTHQEPDPDGLHCREVIERLDELTTSASAQAGALDEIYLWIDYCCLPQAHGGEQLSDVDLERLRAGLALLPNLVKSCELMIIDSPDYIERVWCHAELTVWLCKLAEIRAVNTALPRSRLFGEVAMPKMKWPDPKKELVAFLEARGYGGSPELLVQLNKVIDDYCNTAFDSASYTMGAYDIEYVPNLIGFMCTAWYRLEQLECAVDSDRGICLVAMVNALKFVNTAYGS